MVSLSTPLFSCSQVDGVAMLVATLFKIQSHLHQNSCPDHTNLSVRVRAMKLLRIILRNRCWPTTFHTTTFGDVDEWCCYLQHCFHAPGRAGGRRCDIGCCDLVRNSCPDQIKLSVPSGSSHQIAWGCVQK